ncbi:MAG TPA: AsmA family protein [Candidatus Sulfotelmatobacter sp.]|nr:AsmA family protein [Candidatus Sulfotelmatobacter sp.]
MAVAAVLLLLLFLLRPGASRLKSRIAASISAGLARPVEIGSVHLRLLPRPGFDLQNLVVYDDPAFGQEPMLRAPEVTADLRLTSLVRGRLEIARLDVTEPSLNLVHGDNGRWNLEALLQHASNVPLAPTAKARSEARPAFPYIQVTSGRINFKSGREKKPYALTNADFALWQDSENAWGIRLKAEPFRSDLNLNDTGILRVNGTWHRAATLRETPLQFSVEWDRPQLGQLTKFVSGEDKGWRGGVQLDVTLTGTPASLRVSGDASVQDFRRYDISSGQALPLAAHCDGRYSSVDHLVHEVFCRVPVGSGQLTLKGDMGSPASHRYDLVLNAEDLPAGALVTLAQRAKKNLPEDIEASGEIRGILKMRRNGFADGAGEFSGSGEMANLRLTSASRKAELDAASIPLKFVADDSAEILPPSNAGTRRSGHRSLAGERRLHFGPFPLAAGRGAGPTVRGWAGHSGYGIGLLGDAEVARTLRMATLFGLPALAATVDGQAKVDLQIAGTWRGWMGSTPSGVNFARPQVTGTAKLHNVRAEVRGVDEPIEISSANLQLLPDKVLVTKLSANAAHALWTGSLELPRGCGTPGACAVSFNLNTNQFGLSDVAQWLSPRARPRPWYRLSTANDPLAPTFFTSLHADGKITANRLLLHAPATNQFPVNQIWANHVSADVSLDAGQLRLSDLRAELLGGKHRGEWQADFSVRPAVYTGSGTLTGIALRQMAAAMHDDWIAGTASGSYQMTASGVVSSAFWNSAEGTLQFEMHDGMLPHLLLVSDGDSLKVERMQARVHLQNGKIEIKEGNLDSPAGKFLISGTASFSRALDLRLASKPDSSGGTKTYAIGGTVAEPRVTQVVSPETQARLKP